MVYDLIILGGGPAGYLAAERAAHAGLSTLCIEERSVGGVCLNEGCIPTKTLLYSAKLLDGTVNGSKYGLAVEGANIDHSAVIKRKDKVVRQLVAGVKASLKAKGAELISATGSVTGRSDEGYMVEAGGQSHTGKRLLIATGSEPTVPPIPGLDKGLKSGFVLTNRDILALKERPAKLVVIGGGVIGLEMASYFNSIGSEVCVVEMLDHIAGENDADLTSILQKNYENKGVQFILSARVTAITDDGVTYEQDGKATTLPADKVLLSIGRRARTEGIGLERLGVMLERGAIVTDEHLRTNLPGVYAAGDVNGKSMLAHTAYREAEVAVNHMLGRADSMRYDAIPSVIYTNPELGAAGYTLQAARARGIDAYEVKLPMQYSGRYVAENEGGNGIAKLVLDRDSGFIIGAHVLGNYSSEFILSAVMMIDMRMTLERIKQFVFPHPTVCEILREAVFSIDDNK